MKKIKLLLASSIILFFTCIIPIHAESSQRYGVCTYTQNHDSVCSGSETVLSCFFEWSNIPPISKYEYWHVEDGELNKVYFCDEASMIQNGLNISPDIIIYPDKNQHKINAQLANGKRFPILDFDSLLPSSCLSYAMKVSLIENNIVLDFFARDHNTTDIFVSSFSNPDFSLTMLVDHVLTFCKTEPTPYAKNPTYKLIEHKKQTLIRKDKLNFTVIPATHSDDPVKIHFINPNVIHNNDVTFRAFTVDGKEWDKSIILNTETLELSIKYGALPKGIVMFSASYNSDGVANTYTFKYVNE